MMLRYQNEPELLTRQPPPLAQSRRFFIDGELQRQLIYVLLALGLFFRVFHFFNNRSLFIDELFLSVNVIKLNFWQLATGPFEYQQKAPIGYLWASRFFVLLLGKQEPALRFFSLLCGIGTMLVFVPVAQFFLRSWGAVLAVGIVALAYPLVYHSVEAKQYSTELFATVLALYLYTKYVRSVTLRPFLAWGILGGLLPWFSFSVIFVLAGIGAAICASATFERNRRRLAWCLIPCFLWVMSFVTVYVLFISKYQDSGWLSHFFKVKYDGYLPVTHAIPAVEWLVVKGYQFLSYPLGLPLKVDNTLNYFGFKHFLTLGWLPLSLIGAGAFYLLLERKEYFLILFLPVVLTLIASALQRYPFHQRFTVFLAPLLILALAYGAQELSARYFPSRRFVYMLGGLVLLPSLANSTQQVISPETFYNREYYRDIVLFVDKSFAEGDAVYVYWNMHQAYNYYKHAYPLRYTAIKGSYVKNQSISQADYLKNLQSDFATLKGKKRVWFMYDSNNRDPIGDYVDQPAWYHDKAFPPGRLLNGYFSTIGQRKLLYHKGNYVVALYELNP